MTLKGQKNQNTDFQSILDQAVNQALARKGIPPVTKTRAPRTARRAPEVVETPEPIVARKPGRPRKSPVVDEAPALEVAEAPARKGRMPKNPTAAKAVTAVVGSRLAKIKGTEIPEIVNAGIVVDVVGLTDLIVKNFSQKAQEMIENKQQGKATKRAVRDPKDECEDGRIRDDRGRDCVRAVWFKKGLVAMGKTFGIPASAIEQSLWIEGANGENLIPIEWSGKKPTMRADRVVLRGKFGSKTTSIAYRPSFPGWKIRGVKVVFDTNVLTPEQVLALFAHAGAKNGIGEWRPERGGDFGRYRIEPVSGKRKARK